MDLMPFANGAMEIVAAISAPLAGMLITWGMSQAQARWKFTVSQQLQDRVQADVATVVNMGIGWARAQLANGQMGLSDVTTGNMHVDHIAGFALDMLSNEARASGITKDDMARHIIAGVGHELGNDPTVPTVALPAVPSATVPLAAAAESTPAPVPVA